MLMRREIPQTNKQISRRSDTVCEIQYPPAHAQHRTTPSEKPHYHVESVNNSAPENRDIPKAVSRSHYYLSPSYPSISLPHHTNQAKPTQTIPNAKYAARSKWRRDMKGMHYHRSSLIAHIPITPPNHRPPRPLAPRPQIHRHTSHLRRTRHRVHPLQSLRRLRADHITLLRQHRHTPNLALLRHRLALQYGCMVPNGLDPIHAPPLRTHRRTRLQHA